MEEDIETSFIKKNVDWNNAPVTGINGLYAYQIATTIASTMPKKEQKKLLEDVLLVFELWRNKYGCIKIDKLIKKSKPLESEHGRLNHISNELPWDGDNSPISLFWRLFAIDYQPLMKCIKKSSRNYERIISLLIIESINRNYISGDFVPSALKLARHYINKTEGASKAKLRGERKSRLIRAEQKEAKMLLIRETHAKLVKQAWPKRGIQKEIAHRTKISAPTVNKYIKSMGLQD